MADTAIDKLKIEIEASASKAENSVDKLIKYVEQLQQAVGKIDTSRLYSLAGAITSLGDGLKNMPSSSSFTSLAKGIEKLKGIDTSGIDSVARSVSSLTDARPESLEDLAIGVMDLSQAMRNLPSTQSYNRLVTGINTLNNANFSNLGNLANTVGNLANSLSGLNNVAGSITGFVNAVNNASGAMGNFINNAQTFANATQQVHQAANNAGNATNGLQNALLNLRAFMNTLNFGRLSNGLRSLSNSCDNVIERLENFKQGISGILSGLKTLDSFIPNLTKKISSFFKSLGNSNTMFGKFERGTKSLGKALETLNTKLGKVTRLFTFMLLRKGITAIFSQLGTAFQHLAKKSEEFNANISALISACSNFSHQVASLVGTLLDIFGPALTYIINLLSTAVSYINQFLSALTGKTAFVQAKKVATDYADSLDKASKAAKSMLAGIDELNVINTSSGSSSSSSDLEDCYEELEINSKILDLAEQFKNIMSDIFTPFKKSWDENGKYVMDSWKYAFNEIKDLAKSVASDFMEVWKQPETTAILNDMSHIIGDIGQIVGNLAGNFKLAWDENETGLHILENIRDIIGVIVSNIHGAVEATVEWSKNLDFSPLLQKIEEWTSTLVPVFEFLSGTISDFYTTVLLPLGKWVLEEGLPDLLQVFIDFNNEVNWEELKTNLQTFWEHLEPFAETVGEGLVLFVQDIADALKDFLNSEKFVKFLEDVEAWMDDAQPEDIADALEKLAKAIIAVKLAVIGFTALSGAVTVIETLTKVLKGLAFVGSKLSGLAGTISEIIAGFGGIGGFLTADIGTTLGTGTAAEIGLTIGTGIIGGIAAAFAGFELGKFLGEHLFPDDASWYEDFHWFSEGGFFDTISSDWGTALDALGDMIWDGFLSIFNFDMTQELFSVAGDFFSDITDAFGENDWGRIGADILNGIIAGLLGALSLLTEPFIDLFNAIVDGICAIFGIHSPAKETEFIGENILLGIIEGFKEKYDTCKETITEWAGKVKDWFTGGDGSGNIFEKFKGFAGDIVSGFKDKVKDKYVTVKDNVTEWASSVKTWFTGGDGKGNIIEKFKGFAGSIISGFKGNISDNYTRCRTTLSTWASDVKNAFEGSGENKLSERFKTIASDVVSGFTGGIIDFLKDSIETVKGWAESVVSAVKNALGIHSPSKVFAELGDYTVAGFNDGLEKAGATTNGVMQEWIESFSNMTVNVGVGLDVDDSELSKLRKDYNINGQMDINAMADYLNANLLNGNDNYEQMNLMREQNELLRQILEKDLSVSGDDVFKVVRKKANEYYRANRKFAFDI